MKTCKPFKLPRSGLAALAIGVKRSQVTAIVLIAIGASAPPATAQFSLSDALDTTNLVWTTGGSASWSRQANVSYDGVDAARSGSIFDGQESWLQTTVTGPGTVAFWWKVSSEGDYDMLEYYIGGARQSRISGEQDWRQVAFSVPSGSQTLRWRYVKDSGDSLGQDVAWVDEVRFAPNTGPPVILVQPVSQTVVTSVTAQLQVSAAGSQPLSYLWFRDETNLIAGATTATLTLTNVQLTDGAQYRVVVTNLNGSVSSSNALFAVTTLGQVNNILLLVDHSLVSPYESALTNQYRPYRRFSLASELAFNRAVESADPGRSLVLVDMAAWGHNLGYVERFARAGGRVILQYQLLGLNDGSTAPAAFEVTVAQSLSFPQAVYNWGGSSFFAGVPSPINFQDIGLFEGQKLQPTGGARAVAGFVSARTDNEAAVVIGNSNRTIVNGFILGAATLSTGAARFAQNEIDYLAGPPVPVPPVISIQPEDVTTLAGATARFTLSASGPAPLRYQWYFNQTNALANATNATLVITNVQQPNVGGYHALVTNAVGSVTSRVAVLTLTAYGPVSTVLLYNDYAGTIYENALRSFSLSVQRYSDNSAFNAAIRSASPATRLVIVDAVSAPGRDLSAFEEFVRSGGRALLQYLDMQAGSLSTAFDLATVQPFELAPPVYDWGGSGFFEEVATPLSMMDFFIRSGQRYQPVAGTQTVAGFTSSPTVGQAAIVIGNSGRTIVNGFALEEVSDFDSAVRLAQNEVQFLLSTVLTIIQQPVSLSVRVGSSITNTVSALSRSGPITYQWRFNGTNLPGATSSNLVITSVQLAHEGNYSVVVSDSLSSVTSSNATLAVLIAPAFVQQPLSQSVVVGGSVTFSAQFTGNPPPFTSEWRRLTAPLATNTFIASDRLSFFTLTGVQASDTANYRLVIKSASSPAIGVGSAQFSLTVLADSDGDGLPDVWEAAYPTCADPALDCDNDGLTNLEEYRAGTDPTNAASVLRITRFTVGSPTTLEFEALSNKTYTVQHIDRVGGGSWSKLLDVVARATSRTETATDAAAGTNRYYRVVTPRQP